ncbi:MAG TPA: glycosyltransferase family 4 protein [Ignavibacteriaceae bacterium]|nr:glycosyltransferase family 4 protein [Ignavibacteriaceae bacterium]
MKTAIIHEWLVNYGGSERCVESFVNIWNDAPVFALVDFLNDSERKIILNDKHTVTSFIQNLPFAKKKHRNYLPLFPLAVEQFDLNDYELIISSSHAVAKGVLTNSNQLHICYCHTPIRYAWDLTHQYLNEAGLSHGLKSMVVKSILHYIRNWDITSSLRPDYFIANSKYIARRINKLYRRDAEVIYPPVDTDLFPVEDFKDEYYLTAARFVPYKRVDLIAEAFSQMPDKKLIIIGEGSEQQKIKSKSGKNVELVGYQKTEDLKKYLQKAKAFVFAAEEDFGISVIEAMSCGTPVIAFSKGGTGETVIDGQTGILFDEQNAASIISAVKRFVSEIDSFDPAKLNQYAKQFDRKIFEQNILNFVEEKYRLFNEFRSK